MREVNVEAAILKYDAPVMFLVLKNHILLTPKNIREIADTAEQLSGGKPYLLFSDARARIQITDSGRFAASDQRIVSLIRAGAVLIDSFFVKFIVNLALRYNKFPFPFRIFTNAAKALDWLKQQNQFK